MKRLKENNLDLNTFIDDGVDWKEFLEKAPADVSSYLALHYVVTDTHTHSTVLL